MKIKLNYWIKILNNQLLLISLLLLIFTGCKKEETQTNSLESNSDLPELETISAIPSTFHAVSIKGRIIQKGGAEIIRQGICWSTKPNPTLETSSSFTVPNTTSSLINSVLQIFTEGTTYYIRVFATNSFGTGYGNDIMIKTYGWIGPGGGLVFYDKGYYSNGWRYLEVSKETIPGNNNEWVQWGSKGTLINGANRDSLGSGYENTIDMFNANLIKEPGSAVLMNDLIKGYKLNGFNDWYIPCIKEIKQALNCLDFTNNKLPKIETQRGFSTSVQKDAQEYYGFHKINGTYPNNKKDGSVLWPMRRF